MRRLPQTKRTWIGFRGGAYSGANLFAASARPKLRRRSRCGGRSSRTARRAGGCSRRLGRRCCWARCLRLADARPDAGSVGRKLGLNIRTVELSDPLAAVDVDKPADHALVDAILEGRGMNDLAIYDMDRTVTRRATYTPFLLHCALRRAPWRLLLLPFVVAVDAGLRAELIDRGEAEGDQPSPAARAQRSTEGAKPLVDSFAERRWREYPAGRACRDRARQGGRPAAGDGDRLLPALRRRHRRSAWLRRRHRHRLDHRPRRARPRQDRWRELLRAGQAADDRGLARRAGLVEHGHVRFYSDHVSATRRCSNGPTSRSRSIRTTG